MTEHQPELIPQTNALTTPKEQAKRDEYRRRLVEYLKDPKFRAIEGFPIGTDEDILALSDPPYYTACPNPFLPEIIEHERTGFLVTNEEEMAAAITLESPDTVKGCFLTLVAADQNP